MNARRTLSAVAIGACGPVALSVMGAAPAHAVAYTSNDCKIVADPPTYNSGTGVVEGRGLVICTQTRALTINAQLKKDFGASGWVNVGTPGNSSPTASSAFSNYARQNCDFPGVANIKTVVTVTADGSAPAVDYGPTRSFSCD